MPSKRRLHLESLEDRRLLHGATIDAADHHDAAAITSHGNTPEFVPGEVLVSFEGDVANLFSSHGKETAVKRADRAVEVLGLHSPKVLMHLPGRPGREASLATRWTLAPGADVLETIEQLNNVAGVAFAEPNYVLTASATPNDPRFDELWGMNNTGQTGGTSEADIDALGAWGIHAGGGDVVVGVIDTGVRMDHADLVGQIWTNPGEIANGLDDDGNGLIDDFNGWDFVNNDNDPTDDNKHGTHVSGTIGAVGDNGIGVVGVNQNVKIMPLKFLNNQGSGSTDDAILAMDYVNTMRQLYNQRGEPSDPDGVMGANIVLTNNSWGGGGFSQMMYDAIELNGQRNMLFVAAAGNTGGGVSYPALYDLDNIISVAATDHNDALASFSSRGNGADLAAPGVDILSTVRGSSYTKLSGTSMASPHVAGAASLLWDLVGSDTPYETIRDLLFDTVDVLPALSGAVATSGRLNIGNALNAVKMEVVSSTPAADEVVSTATPPTVFYVNFSFPAEPALFDETEFKVNNFLADTASLSFDGLTGIFTFITPPEPVAAGSNTMSMAYEAVSTAKTLGDSNLQAWSETFYYDTSPLTVNSTVPSDGGIVSLPGSSTLELTFNEPVNVNSVDLSDLVLSRGTVTGASAIGAVATYTLNLPDEEGTLTYELPFGAVSDAAGNPVAAYSGTLEPDFVTIPFPVPLTEYAPAGAAIYHGSVSGTIANNSDVDNFTISVDEGQTITVVLRPDDGLIAKATLLGSVLPAVTGSSAGEPVIIQSVLNIGTGIQSYTIVVASDGSTAGAYTLDVFLNAVADERIGADETPQDIADTNFLDFGIAGLSRAAAVGQVTKIFGHVLSENESGDAFLSTQNDMRGSWDGEYSSGSSSTWSLNDGAGVTGNIGERNGPLGADGQDTWYFTASAGDEITVTAAGYSVDLHDSSGDQLVIGAKNTGSTLTYTVPAGTPDMTDYWLHVYGGKGDYVMTASMTTLTDLKITGDGKDVYQFTAAEGDVLRLVADAMGGQSVDMQLLGPNVPPGLVATSTAALDATLEYTVSADGDYTVEITPRAGTPDNAVIDYGLMVTKNTVLDAQRHDTPETAQPLIGDSVTVLGKIGMTVGNVLWLGSTGDTWNDGSFDVTQVAMAEWDPTATPLDVFDAVYVDSNAGVPNNTQALAIDAFVTAGGGLVTENGGNEGAADFSWVPNADEIEWSAESSDGTIIVGTHPVTTGLNNADLAIWHNVFPEAGGMDVLATSNLGVANILADELGSARVVYLGHDPHGHLNLAGARQLVHNSLDWTAQRDIESDFYAVNLIAGDSVSLSVVPIASGTAEFVNILAPEVSLWDSSGTEITEEVGGGYAIPSSGTYYVKVNDASATPSEGEYALTVNVTLAPGIIVSPTAGLETTEAGGTATFDVWLTTAPTNDVTIGISSSDTSEGTVLPSELVFTSTNWDVVQTVTVTGVDDIDEDGDIGYTIITAATVSGDTVYDGIDAADVSVTNLDDDSTSLGTVHVSDLAGSENVRKKNWVATVTITVVNDSDGLPAEGVLVTGIWNVSGSDSCTTDTSGQCNVRSGNLSLDIDDATFTVDDPGTGGFTSIEVFQNGDDPAVLADNGVNMSLAANAKKTSPQSGATEAADAVFTDFDDDLLSAPLSDRLMDDLLVAQRRRR